MPDNNAILEACVSNPAPTTQDYEQDGRIQQLNSWKNTSQEMYTVHSTEHDDGAVHSCRGQGAYAHVLYIVARG